LRATEEPALKQRAWLLLVGLPLVAAVLGIALFVFFSSYRALALLFGLPVSAVNYRRLRSMSKLSRERGSR
jgi:hypothetical protein